VELSVIRSFDDGADVVEVVVTNEMQTESPNVDALRDRLAWLRSFADPVEAYSAALLSAGDDDSEGGLGLVRVAHEGRATLDCEVSHSGRVRVSATCPTPPWEERRATP
jgi:hypothetical protein